MTEFQKKSNSKDGLRGDCKACVAMYYKKYYIDNKEKLDKKVREWQKKNLEKVKGWNQKYRKKTAEINRAKIAEIHGTKCVYCGAIESKGKLKALELHHPDPAGKDFNVSMRLHHSWKAIEAEVRKCILLCAQCHIVEHKRLRDPKYRKIQQLEAQVKELKEKLKQYEEKM